MSDRAGCCFSISRPRDCSAAPARRRFWSAARRSRASSIRVRQFLLPGFEHERALLSELQAWAKAHGALCTYNGRSFDVPLIETRFMFHRVPCPLDGVPHLDMLHPARRLWRQRPLTTGTPDPDDSSCSLGVLEKHIAGLHRVGDVPGYEIPSRFFKFVRNGDARPLEAVMEHNRLDLISLAAVLARAIALITRGPSAARTAQEAYGLARVYERAGAHENAEAALLRTIEFAKRVGAEPEVHGEALRRLAWIRRRDRRPHEAAEAWQRAGGVAAMRRRAAARSERSARDPSRASPQGPEDGAPARARSAQRRRRPTRARVQHRLDRLERKLARYTEASFPAQLTAGVRPLTIARMDEQPGLGRSGRAAPDRVDRAVDSRRLRLRAARHACSSSSPRSSGRRPHRCR